jgi:signal transduction histidine kinase
MRLSVPRLGRALPRIHGVLVDRAVAVVLLAAGELEVWLSHDAGGHRLVAAAAAAIVAGAVALRRRHPLLVGLVAQAAMSVEFGISSHIEVLSTSAAWVCDVYALAVWTTTKEFAVAVAAIGLLIAIPFAGIFARPANAAFFGIALLVAMLIARHVLGDRDRRLRLAERERDVAAREAVVAERARIARELHDVVAHSVSVMVIQAQAGPRLLAAPESAAEAFRSIETTGRDALVELRRLLGVLRGGDEQPAATTPQPGLDRLQALVEQVRAAGLHVELRVEGEPGQLPAGIDLSAYRIVQEALTNTLKHAGRAEAEVIVHFEPSAVELEVLDNGTGPSPNPNGWGHGLVGMRERVALYGGILEAGSRNGHGFAVRARLPFNPEPIN